MKKQVLSLSLLLLLAFLAEAQGTMQFNAAKILTVADGVQTVPSGKVWKVMSVFGTPSITSECAQLPAYCVNNSWATSSLGNLKVKGFKVNGTVVWRSVDLSEAILYYQFNNCSGSTTALSGYPNCISGVANTFPSQSFEELAASLPFWIPAGASLETIGNTSNISVLEFNIIP